MRHLKTITDPNYSPITFAVAMMIPLFACLLLVAPGPAVVLSLIAATVTHRRIRANRTRRAAALAERKRTWGF